MAATALLLGAAVDARAEGPATPAPATQAPQSQNPSAFTGPAGSSAAPRKSLQWDASGKWTLNLDMDQPVGRDMGLKDVSAGAYFHITPSVRIGGSVGLADRFSETDKIVPQDTSDAPRVHVETKFKF